MRISLNWLQELVDVSARRTSPNPNIGFEVEDIEDRRS
jgi:hypothetical protein